MNFSEGKQFVLELITSFPAFESLAKDSPDLGATHRAWIAAWEDLSLSECQEVLSRLVKGGGITYEDYRAPGPFVRRLVMANRRNQPRSEAELAAQREAIGEKKQRQKQYAGKSMADIVEAAKAMRDGGAAEIEVLEFLDREVAKI